MNLIVEAWHITRTRRDGLGGFADGGYDVVNRGVIEVTSEEIRIYDNEDVEEQQSLHETEVQLTINLQFIQTVQYSRFRSAGGNHRGGQICIIGRFDRGFDEKLILQMPSSDYVKIREYLRPLLS